MAAGCSYCCSAESARVQLFSMRFHLENLGCRATQADGAALAERLRRRGHLRAADAETADVVVVNTCTVTAAADQQARHYLRRLHRKNPAARILVTGCYAQRAPEELAAVPGVAWVVGNSHKQHIPGLVERESRSAQGDFLPLDRLLAATGASAERAASIGARPAKVITGNISEQTAVLVAPVFGSGAHPETENRRRTRPILKIQDGCNHRCAYCIIPTVRGRSRSLPPEEVIAQLKRLEAEGYKEIVLSGVDLGGYGQDLHPRLGLRELTRRILEQTSVPLLRFSSLEPMDLTDEFLALLASSPRVARHIHAPLQSGSDHILRRMHRWYTRDDYAERIRAAVAALPNPGLGADVIVGFPGERDSDFQATVEMVEQLPFSYLHVFSFSARPGTPAARLPEQLPTQVVAERARALRGLAEEKAQRFRAQQLGRILRVLTLGSVHPDGTRDALSENYLPARLPTSLPANELLSVRVTGLVSGQMWAEPLSPVN